MYNVLIIDDEQLIGDGVKAKLERAGLAEISQIHVACGGEEGLQAAADLKPHIVITDMRMPDIDGIQVIRRLSAELPSSKFILLSGYDDYAYVREAFKYGALDYLLKPAGSAELAKQIRTAIAAIAEDDKKAAQAERSRKAERMMLASRLNAVLNGAIHPRGNGDAVNSPDFELTDSYLIHSSAAVALFHISGDPYHSGDLELAQSLLERNAREVGHPEELRLLAFHDGDGSVCAVINFTDDVSFDAASSMIGETVKRLKEAGAEHAVASVSEPCRPADLPKQYKQAKLAMSYRILREPCEVLSTKSDNRSGGTDGKLPARKDIEELRHAVETLQLKRISQWIDRWLPDSLIGSESLDRIKAVYELLLTEIRRRFDGRLPFEEREQIRALASFHTLGDLRRYLLAYTDTAKRSASDNAEPADTVISFAEAFVRENFNREVQLAEVANRVSMNYSYFSKLFKERTGLTFTAYLIKVRMEEASKLLQDPTLRINEVSEKVGYGNLYHFSRAFKNYFGISPKEYRRSR
ncbi:helix-turn-helix domain-containing protein [Paenibacillus sinopodophylli]|uniref:helix-turn-helix domain-containing protein n=1 Tax=Paenibacillus sinopodophylli TaxID=1837342 RepID=UPI0014866BED|nr:helix-turn-helix domain-containing protein [Paenibacillus sinopodophylli]